MRFALGCAFNMHLMFMNFPYKKLHIHWTKCVKLFHSPNKVDVVTRIFAASVKLIISDIIENNTIFILPTGAKKADIRVQRFTGDDFIAARKNKKFRDVDFLKSNFTGHLLALNIYTKGYYRTKPIYIDKKYKLRLTELTNQGKLYG